MHHSKFDAFEPRGLPRGADTEPGGDADFMAALPALIAHVYEQADRLLRAQMLQCLLQPLGPLALVAVASGAFGTFVHHQERQRLQAPQDDALAFSPEQLRELAGFALEIDPGVLVRLDSLLTERPRQAPPAEGLPPWAGRPVPPPALQ